MVVSAQRGKKFLRMFTAVAHTVGAICVMSLCYACNIPGMIRVSTASASNGTVFSMRDSMWWDNNVHVVDQSWSPFLPLLVSQLITAWFAIYFAVWERQSWRWVTKALGAVLVGTAFGTSAGRMDISDQPVAMALMMVLVVAGLIEMLNMDSYVAKRESGGDGGGGDDPSTNSASLMAVGTAFVGGRFWRVPYQRVRNPAAGRTKGAMPPLSTKQQWLGLAGNDDDGADPSGDDSSSAAGTSSSAAGEILEKYEFDFVALRYMQYALTAPLLMVFVLELTVVDPPLWAVYSVFVFMMSCTLMGVLAHYWTIWGKQAMKNANQAALSQGVHWIRSWLHLLPWEDPRTNFPYFMQISALSVAASLSSLFYIVRDVYSTDFYPPVVRGILWMMLAGFGSFAVILCVFYLLMIQTSYMDVILDVLDFLTKFPIVCMVLYGFLNEPAYFPSCGGS